MDFHFIVAFTCSTIKVKKGKGSSSVAAGSADEKQPKTVNAEMRRAIVALIQNDDPIVTTITGSISQAIIAKLVNNTDFTKKIENIE